ncbi:MAG: GatB/YqeY domain-containing protein [Thermodesulfovibrionales bacterium]
MSLLLRIDDDLKSALKHSDALKLSVLRLAKSALTYRQIELKRDLTDDDVAGVLSSLVKQRRESVEMYEKGGRADLAEKERHEIGFLQAYLPSHLSPEELEKLIRQAIEDTSARTEADMGRVMKALMPKIRGRADGRQVNSRVRERLLGRTA